MESLKSQPNPNSVQLEPFCGTAATVAHQSAASELGTVLTGVPCLKCGGSVEPERARHPITRYCRTCAYAVKLALNAARKKVKRKQVGWLAYYYEYAPIPFDADRDAERKKLHKIYMRAYRAFQKHWQLAKLSLDEKTKREYRRDLIKTLVDQWSSRPRRLATRAKISQGTTTYPVVGSRCVPATGNTTSASAQAMHGGQLK